MAVPANPNIVFAAEAQRTTIFSSQVVDDSATCSPLAEAPSEITSFAIGPDGSTLWVMTSGGLFRGNDLGRAWELQSLPALSAELQVLASCHSDTNTLFALDKDGKLWFYRQLDATTVDAPSQVPKSRGW
jgi:hypothetical protein